MAYPNLKKEDSIVVKITSKDAEIRNSLEKLKNRISKNKLNSFNIGND